ncbi:MAG: hypothetical protein JHD02_01610 [Thermoleophilaceae bacterium]|nr:hypothetical protein [Thermoleophilaceae bacterium]
MSKNTRWALALVGAVIIIVAAVVIGTGNDQTDAVQQPSEPATAATGASGATDTATPTQQTGATGTDNGGSPDSGDDNSGGASPSDSGEDSGGASPSDVDEDSSGGAKAQTGAVSPVLSATKVRTVTVDKGETVVIRAVSESSGEMHVHGYDKSVALKPGRIVRVKFKAKIDGEFPIEFHTPSGHVDVGTLRVNP